MEFKDLHVAVGEVVPELDGELAEHMHAHPPASRIVFDEIGVIGGEGGNLAKMFQQVFLLSSPERPELVEHLDGDEQARVAHLSLSDKPSSCSHCSGVSHRPGERSSILSASLAA